MIHVWGLQLLLATQGVENAETIRRSLEEASGRRIHHELRIFIYEEVDDESDHEHYEQPFPVEVPFGAPGVAGKVTLMSGCKWRKKEPTLPASLSFPLLPQDGTPPRRPPRQDPWDPPPPWEEPPPPLQPPERPPTWSPPTYYTTPAMTVSLQVNPLTTNIRVGSGSSFNLNALSTQGSPIAGLPSGGAVVPPPPTSTPPPPPPAGTKTAAPAAKGSLLSGSDSDGSDDQDTPLLVGPELAFPLKADLREWKPMAWLPEGSHLSVYGHALYGDMEIFGSPVDVSLYGVGPRLGVPFHRSGWLVIDGRVSVGPAFLHTDLGDTAGLDATAGLGAEIRLVRTLSFSGSAEYRGFFATDVDAHGPSLNFGINLTW